MKPAVIARVAAGAAAVAIAITFAPPPSPSRATPPQVGEVIVPRPASCFGGYRNRADASQRIVLEPVGDPTLVRVRTSAGWGAIGYLDVEHFEGVVRAADLQGSPLPGPMGTLAFDVQADGTIRATLRRSGRDHRETWRPEVTVSEVAPGYGDPVEVEELPEPIRKPAPAYPDAARRAGIQGTVMVQALVGKDGSVRDTRIVKSIPALDEAAIAAVRRWRFKPALSKGKPMAIWVAVPVQFTLK